jgi:hypothetical protein
MKARATVAFLSFLMAAVMIGVTGLIYLFSPKFMPYHAVAIGVGWEELAPRYQTLFLALLKAVGGGFLATALAALILLFIPYRAKASWARWALLIIGLSCGIPAVYATLMVKWGTPAAPPWYAAVAGIVLTLVGFTLSKPGSARIGEELEEKPVGNQ